MNFLEDLSVSSKRFNYPLLAELTTTTTSTLLINGLKRPLHTVCVIGISNHMGQVKGTTFRSQKMFRKVWKCVLCPARVEAMI